MLASLGAIASQGGKLLPNDVIGIMDYDAGYTVKYIRMLDPLTGATISETSTPYSTEYILKRPITTHITDKKLLFASNTGNYIGTLDANNNANLVWLNAYPNWDFLQSAINNVLFVDRTKYNLTTLAIVSTLPYTGYDYHYPTRYLTSRGLVLYILKKGTNYYLAEISPINFASFTNVRSIDTSYVSQGFITNYDPIDDTFIVDGQTEVTLIKYGSSGITYPWTLTTATQYPGVTQYGGYIYIITGWQTGTYTISKYSKVDYSLVGSTTYSPAGATAFSSPAIRCFKGLFYMSYSVVISGTTVYKITCFDESLNILFHKNYTGATYGIFSISVPQDSDFPIFTV